MQEALWGLSSPNTRRATIVALRSVLGLKLRVPRAVPQTYKMPTEDELRLAMMTTPHETRGLLMAFGGLRLGEACAITGSDLHGDNLRVNKQYVEVWRPHGETVVRIGPVKAGEGVVTLPVWLAGQVKELGAPLPRPSVVRESIRRAGARVGLSLTPHALLHWSATTLLERGVPITTVS